MGFIPEMTIEAGEYWVESRSESFYLGGEGPQELDENGELITVDRRHAFHLYPSPYPDGRQGTVETLTEDIPKLHAALDTVQWCEENRDKEGIPGHRVIACYEVKERLTDELGVDDKLLARVRTREGAEAIAAEASRRNPHTEDEEIEFVIEPIHLELPDAFAEVLFSRESSDDTERGWPPSSPEEILYSR